MSREKGKLKYKVEERGVMKVSHRIGKITYGTRDLTHELVS